MKPSWAESLAQWAIPQHILEAAPESPWGLPVELFVRDARSQSDSSPSRIRALEALPAQGSVLDVGCGAGAASHCLSPPASRLIGVDENADMLAAFADAAPVEHVEIQGRWPEIATTVEIADVVVCNHVLYNVGDLPPFIVALAAHARRRVVVEILEEHPLAWMNPIWRELHGVVRPTEPHAEDALALIRSLQPNASIEYWDRPSPVRGPTLANVAFAFLRKTLCLSTERDDELRSALSRTPQPTSRRVATIWWDADS